MDMLQVLRAVLAGAYYWDSVEMPAGSPGVYKVVIKHRRDGTPPICLDYDEIAYKFTLRHLSGELIGNYAGDHAFVRMCRKLAEFDMISASADLSIPE